MVENLQVVIKGRFLPDDGLQIDLSGPAGQTRFSCPDCDQEVVFEAAGTVVCRCGSLFRAECHTWVRGRSVYWVRRAPAL